MSEIDPKAARRFAKNVVEKLCAAGYEALWAGGCVRDQLLEREPKDYDVATNAKPEEIRELFGRRRTLAIGAAFGVITVLGKRNEGQIEVATFRQDATYSDGRHPDSVKFSSAKEDAKRRDFTINGLFFDPLKDRVIDYVGGQDDLSKKVVRAIGDPDERIGEDKLRMLRAVRFTATYGFELDPGTATAIKQRASEMTVVSAERIAEEMRKMLRHPDRSRAISLLEEVGLLGVILAEADLREPADAGDGGDTPWQRTLHLLARIGQSFPMALASLLREAATGSTEPRSLVEQVGQRWRLSNDEVSRVVWLLNHEAEIREANELPWPRIQRILIHVDADELLDFSDAVRQVLGGPPDGVAFCREKLTLTADELNPSPLIDGNDLKSLGMVPGPGFKDLLNDIRDAQLDGKLQSRQDALDFVMRWKPE